MIRRTASMAGQYFLCQKIYRDTFYGSIIKPAHILARSLYAFGYTLLELIVALSIIGILLSVSIPLFLDFVNAQKVVGVSNSISAWIESIRRSSGRGDPCLLSIQTGTLDEGDLVLAGRSPAATTILNHCNSNLFLKLESVSPRDKFLVNAFVGNDPLNEFGFSPRGVPYDPTTGKSFSSPITFSISLKSYNGTSRISPRYCITYDSLLGTASITRQQVLNSNSCS